MTYHCVDCDKLFVFLGLHDVQDCYHNHKFVSSVIYNVQFTYSTCIRYLSNIHICKKIILNI